MLIGYIFGSFDLVFNKMVDCIFREDGMFKGLVI